MQRYLMIVALAIVGVLAASAMVVLPHLTKGFTLQESLLALVGATETHEYATASAVPSDDKPTWLPTDATDVRTAGWPVARGAELRLSATVPAGTTPPASCVTAPYSAPWDGADDWPDLSHDQVVRCDGDWFADVRGTTLYAWH